MEKTQAISKGQYAMWRGAWHRVLWAGRTRDGRDMVKLATLPTTWPDRTHWIPLGEVERVRKTKPPVPSAGPKRTKLDVEFDRRLAREE